MLVEFVACVTDTGPDLISLSNEDKRVSRQAFDVSRGKCFLYSSDIFPNSL